MSIDAAADISRVARSVPGPFGLGDAAGDDSWERRFIEISFMSGWSAGAQHQPAATSLGRPSVSATPSAHPATAAMAMSRMAGVLPSGGGGALGGRGVGPSGADGAKHAPTGAQPAVGPRAARLTIHAASDASAASWALSSSVTQSGAKSMSATDAVLAHAERLQLKNACVALWTTSAPTPNEASRKADHGG